MLNCLTLSKHERIQTLPVLKLYSKQPYIIGKMTNEFICRVYWLFGFITMLLDGVIRLKYRQSFDLWCGNERKNFEDARELCHFAIFNIKAYSCRAILYCKKFVPSSRQVTNCLHRSLSNCIREHWRWISTGIFLWMS